MTYIFTIKATYRHNTYDREVSTPPSIRIPLLAVIAVLFGFVVMSPLVANVLFGCIQHWLYSLYSSAGPPSPSSFMLFS